MGRVLDHLRVWRGPMQVTKAVCLCSLVLCMISHSRGESKHVDGTSSTIINLGSVLTTDQNSSWVSRNGTFALGFHPVGLYTYTLSIWYAAIPVKTVIWTANRNNLVIEGASVSFRSDGNLVLMDSLQIRPVWETNTSSMNVFTAELLDTGNFVLRNAALDVVWDSFSNPSDTLLPDQKLSAGMQLVSSAQATRNAAIGRYSLRQNEDGSLRLYYLPSSTSYWSATTLNNSNSSSFADSFMYLNSSGFLALYNNSGSILASWMTTDVGPGPSRFLKLGAGGDLRVYSWSPELVAWRVVWKALSDECAAINLCGPYGVCSYEPDPVCTCPPTFSFVNPNDSSQGCQPPLALNCSTGSSGQQFLNLDNTQYEGDEYINLQGVSETECMLRCSEDCACLGIFYFYNGNGTCSLRSQLRSGHLNPVGNSYLKVNGAVDLTNLESANNSKSSQSSSHHGSLVRPEIVAGLVCGFTLVCCLLTACCYHWWKEARTLHHQGAGSWSSADFIPGAPTRFSFKDLQAATLNFSLKIGEGDFGTVYKGLLPDGTSIAVKHLEGSQEGEKQFRAEVATIGSSHHLNLVRLFGFCSEGAENRLLVYEFVGNGSLDKSIFCDESSESKLLAQMMALDSNNSGRSSLEWSRRFRIILGTARALAYLHEECRESIIHCNVSTQNILLDEQWEAKLSDFGIAKLMAQKVKDQTKLLTTARGPRGYLAPECASNALITIKSDVYSFGVVILEVVSGKRNRAADQSSTSNAGHRPQGFFSDWGFYRALTQGKLSEMMDKNLGKKFDAIEAERALKVAAWCVQDDPTSRPSMGTVVHMLEGVIAVPAPSIPRPPFQKNLESQRSSRASDISEATTPEVVPLKGIADAILEFDLNSPLISKAD